MILFFLLISVMPLTRHPLWAAIVGDMTVTKWLGSACLLYTVLHLAARGSVPAFFATAQSKWMMLYLGIVFISAVTNGIPYSLDASPITSYASFFLLLFITLGVVDSLPRLEWVLLVVVGSVAFASLYVIRDWQYGFRMYGLGYRPGFIVGDANYFSVSTILAIPLGISLALQARSKWQKLIYVGCSLISFGGQMLGASRGGLVGLVLAGFYLILRLPNRVRNLTLITLLAIPILLVSPSSPIRRFLHPVKGDEQAIESRHASWWAGVNMTKTHPLAGVGLGNFKDLAPRYDPTGTMAKTPHIAHNAYIEIAAELGIPALLLFFAILSSSLLSLERVLRRARALGQPLLRQGALGLEAGLIGAAVSIVFVSGQYQKLLWLVICLTMSLPPLMYQASRSAKLQRQAALEPDAAPAEWGSHTNA